MQTIIRNYAHRVHGQINEVKLTHNCDKMLIDGRELPAQSIEYLINFGLQSLQDAYANAKTQAEAAGAHLKKLEALLNGTIGTRSGGVSVTEATKVARTLVRALLKDKWGVKSAEWATFTGLSDDDAEAKLDEIFEKNKDKLQARVDARLAELAAEREAKRKLVAEVEISI